MSTTIERSRIAKEAFLEVFAQTGVVGAGLKAAQVTRRALSSWLEHDVEFTVRYHEAEKDAIDTLEMLALKRAYHGSDRVLLAMLRARDPQRWRDSARSDTEPDLTVTYTNDWRPNLAEEEETVAAE